MPPIFPQKLQPGDEVRVIAPSRSLKIVSEENVQLAIEALEALGLKVTFGRHVQENDQFQSSSIHSRIADLHEAFQDPNVKAIFAVIGGSNANQLLSYIDFDLIKQHPKMFFGFSDITVLQNAIYHKTGLVTYSGPQFSTFAMQKGFEYTLAYFKKIAFEKEPVTLETSEFWSDDPWYLDQEKRTFLQNSGYWVIHEGAAQGTILGGNLCTSQLLHGTPFMPSIENKILFIEECVITDLADVEFDRDLQSLLHQPLFHTVKALVFGRFEHKFNMDREKFEEIIRTKQELNNIPIIANADFGHTSPIFTFPIGGTCSLRAGASGNVKLVIERH